MLLADSILNILGVLMDVCPGLGEVQCLIYFKDSGCCIPSVRTTKVCQSCIILPIRYAATTHDSAAHIDAIYYKVLLLTVG